MQKRHKTPECHFHPVLETEPNWGQMNYTKEKEEGQV